ncbi:solute carrier family 22 member 6-A-like, partial [Protopterus annectens]|uniref:solute carrier family 22 member 6-A-like n=1 Tax=Protopterus annectens TaxID=7888 RepID=UPI001CF96C1E
MGFSEILDSVGGMGPFQIIYIILLCIPMIMLSSHSHIQNFSAAIPDHYCKIYVNDTQPINFTEGIFDTHQWKVFIPEDSKEQPEKCLQYSTPQWDFLNESFASTNISVQETVPCKNGWVYDKSMFTSTIISEWDLVCSRQFLKQVAQTIYMAGILVGALLYGYLSDRYGRRIIIIGSYLQMAIAGTCVAFSPNYIAYCIFRFLAGMASSGMSLNCLSLTVEWTPTNLRTFTGTIKSYCSSVSQLTLAGYAYLIRDWRWLQFLVSAPYFIFFLYSWWLPESARWLILNNKATEAVKQLKRVAKFNGKKESGENITPEMLNSSVKDLANVKSSYTLVDLVYTPKMRKISLYLSFAWFATSFSYYGLALDLQKFGISIYLVQVFFAVIDIPAKIICMIVMSFVGRRTAQACALTAAGLTIITNIFVPQEMRILRTSLAVMGKGFLASSFTCLYLYTSELYPTVIRQTGAGFGSTMARVGSMTAPMVRLASSYASFLPLAIYGGAPIVSGIIACFLPETRNTQLPDTIDEVENRRKKLLQ